ncbi:MAG: hypothetical protein AAFN41_05440 [Planctomycetota bacterium]
MATRRVHKPIWGFGSTGWIASALLVGIVVAVLSGVDLQHLMIVGVFHLLGIDAVYLLVTTTIPFTWLAIIGNQPSPVLLAWIAIGWHIAGSRIPWWAWLAAAITCFVGPSLLIWSYTISPVKGIYDWSPLERMDTYWLLSCIVLGGVALIASLPFRTRTSIALWSTAVALSVVVVQLDQRDIRYPVWDPNPTQRNGIVLSFHPFNVGLHAFAVAAMVHAGLAHRRRHKADACQSCGYSRDGLAEDAACPECGFTPSPSPPPAPPPHGPAP